MHQVSKFAYQLQQDMVVLTHQLQGPLIAAIGALSSINRSVIQVSSRERLNTAQVLIEDALLLCYGISTSLAHEAGHQISFSKDSINAPIELNKLCSRLRISNARDDLKFVYRQAEDFPDLKMDRNVFTSVMYSLIHNVMKYADEGSTVTLECAFFQKTSEPVLEVKSIGEPINPNEAKVIFEKFRRGSVVANSGRHHSGLGMGLWVARELIRAVGGDLTVELSPDFPRLSVFVVHFPTLD